jgi:hypothetical protein
VEAGEVGEASAAIENDKLGARAMTPRPVSFTQVSVAPDLRLEFEPFKTRLSPRSEVAPPSTSLRRSRS